jgi:hypothetical protein
MGNINDSIEAGASSRSVADITTQVTFVTECFKNGFSIQKRPCGTCWICNFPIYLYKIIYKGYSQQLNTCGEMEHVFPPGFGSMVGTISSRAKTMKERLNTVPPVNQRGGINEAELDRAEDVLVKFGLRASHAWCNKIKSDLIFLVISMLGLLIQGFEYDTARITAFHDEVIKILTDPEKQLPWNYELQFRSGYLTKETIDPLNQQLLYDVELKTPETFASNCGENIKALMTEFSEAAVTVNKANFEVIEGADNAVATQIKLRTIMYSVIFWHDVLVNSENKSAAAYLAIWKNYQRGGKYKHKGGVNTDKLNDTLNTYITSMVGMITDTDIENVERCTPQTGDNPFEEALDTMNDPRRLQIEIVQAKTPAISRAPTLLRALSQVMTPSLETQIHEATISELPPTLKRILSSRPSASAYGTPYPPTSLFTQSMGRVPLRRSQSLTLTPLPPSLTRQPSNNERSRFEPKRTGPSDRERNGGSRKQRKQRKPHNHRTRKQKKHKKTRKIKKLTKRF